VPNDSLLLPLLHCYPFVHLVQQHSIEFRIHLHLVTIVSPQRSSSAISSRDKLSRVSFSLSLSLSLALCLSLSLSLFVSRSMSLSLCLSLSLSLFLYLSLSLFLHHQWLGLTNLSSRLFRSNLIHWLLLSFSSKKDQRY
jgi:hypothetical protein